MTRKLSRMSMGRTNGNALWLDYSGDIDFASENGGHRPNDKSLLKTLEGLKACIDTTCQQRKICDGAKLSRDEKCTGCRRPLTAHCAAVKEDENGKCENARCKKQRVYLGRNSRRLAATDPQPVTVGTGFSLASL